MNKQNDLPNPLTAAALATGQGEISIQLLTFFETLFCGADAPTDHIERQARSVCDDVVFITTRGRPKPGKHLCLALGIKKYDW